MSLIVQKFGGSSVRDAEHLRNAAGIIAETYLEGHDVLAVLSAQGDATDELIKKALEVNPHPSKRELDMLLSTGEQISAALCAMTLATMGLPCVSLAAWQAGIRTTGAHMDARIKRIEPERIQTELDRHRIVLITGFQGVDQAGDVTTLGRGGSDTSAVALAAAFGAELCQIYTDVDGVYTTDPRVVSNARKLEEISCDEMLELASQGAGVLHSRSVELAKKYRVDLEVRSSLGRMPGTKVREVTKMDKTDIAGIAKDTTVAQITLAGLRHHPETESRVFDLLDRSGVHADMILHPAGWEETGKFSFTIRGEDLQDAADILNAHREELHFDRMEFDAKVGKVSVVGAGVAGNRGVEAEMLETLREAGISIRMINTSEIRVTVLLDEGNIDRAVQAIHAKFFEEE